MAILAKFFFFRDVGDVVPGVVVYLTSSLIMGWEGSVGSASLSQRHFAYSLRNSEGRLTLSKPSTNYLKRSFSYSGAMLWNNLPKNLKNAASVEHFKRNIKKVADISDSHTAIM